MVPTQDEARARRGPSIHTETKGDDTFTAYAPAEVTVTFDPAQVRKDGTLDELIIRLAARVHEAERERDAARIMGDDALDRLGQRARELNEARRKLRMTRERIPELDERTYTAAEVGDLQASEAALVSAPLRRTIERQAADLAKRERRIEELEGSLDRFKAYNDEARRELAGASGKITGLQIRLKDMTRDRDTYMGRAGQFESERDKARRALQDAEVRISNLQTSLAWYRTSVTRSTGPTSPPDED